MLVLTAQAQQVIRDIVEDGDAGPDGGLRITGTGSNGDTALEFDVATGPEPGDEVVKDGGATVYLDATAAAALGSMTLDVHAHGDHFHFSIDEQ